MTDAPQTLEQKIARWKRHAEEASQRELNGVANGADYRTAKLIMEAKEAVLALVAEVKRLSERLAQYEVKCSVCGEVINGMFPNGEPRVCIDCA